jgi:hypothetical protein
MNSLVMSPAVAICLFKGMCALANLLALRRFRVERFHSQDVLLWHSFEPLIVLSHTCACNYLQQCPSAFFKLEISP